MQNCSRHTNNVKLENSKRVALELGDLLDKICSEHEIDYTLLLTSIYSQVHYRGFAPPDSTLYFGMIYDDFVKFKKVCRKYLEDDYFIADSTNTPQFEDVFLQILKKSKVKLPIHRKCDEIYYSYSIYVIPILYAGDERKQMFRTFKRYLKTKGKDGCYQDIEKMLLTYKDHRTEYVIIPRCRCVQSGVSILLSTYKSLEYVEFEGHKYKMIKNPGKWLEDYYGKKYLTFIENRRINTALMLGPEYLRRIQLIELEMLVELDRICRKNDIKYVLIFGTLLGAVRHKGFIPWDDDIDVAMLYEDYKRFLKIAQKELNKDKFFLKNIESDEDCNLTFSQIKRNNTVYAREGRENKNTHSGLFIDILPLYNGANNILFHKFQHKLCRFFKRMLWAHLGADKNRTDIRGKYYYLLSKVSNKKSFWFFEKCATMYKKNKGYLAYLAAVRNPYNTPFTQLNSYKNLVEIEFEGHYFFAPSNYDDILKYSYKGDYNRFPPVEKRIAIHMPRYIEIGNLYNEISNDKDEL